MDKKKPGLAPEGGVSRACSRKLQARKQRDHSWTPERRTDFLEKLALTCNVRKALEDSGMSESGLYQLRKRDAAFAREFDEALDHGYALLEAAMLDRAVNGQTREVMNPKGEVVTLQVVCNKLGMNLLHLHARRVAAIRAAREAMPEIADEETLRRKVAETFDRLAEHREWMARNGEAPDAPI